MDDEYSPSEEWITYPPDVPTPLYTAASNKDHNELARLLEISNVMVNHRDRSEYTPIQIAIHNHDIASVKLLLSHGADPKLQYPRFQAMFEAESTSLTEAADLGYVDILRLLIENGCPVPSIALYNATESGQLECVKEIFAWLVNNNRDEFDDGVAKRTATIWALQSAAAGWRVEIVEFILASGEADKNAVDTAFLEAMIPHFDHDDYPKRNCVRKGPIEEARKKRIEVVRLLLEAGADVDATDRISLWGIPTMKPLHEIARQGNQAKEIFDMLLDKNVKVDSLNKEGIGYDDGKTPLFQAVLADDVYFVERLLEKGANVTHVDKFGNTLLHASTFNYTPACPAILSLLLSHGLSYDAKNSSGRTALHEASSNGNVEAVKLLLASHRDLIMCKTSEGWTPLHFAADRTTEQPKIDVTAVLLAYGADINAVTTEGWTVLYRAVTGNPYDRTPFLEFLLQNGADITVTDSVESLGNVQPNHISDDPASAGLRAAGVVRQIGDSLLHLALDKSYVRRTTNTLRLLLDSGADVERKDAQGRTPLLRAVGKWDASADVHTAFRSENVMELINRGADIHVKDNSGLGLEDRVKNKGYTMVMKNGKVVGFEKTPGKETEVRIQGPPGFGRGWGRGRGRARELAGPQGQGRGHGSEISAEPVEG